jgi:hypothetical protein
MLGLSPADQPKLQAIVQYKLRVFFAHLECKDLTTLPLAFLNSRIKMTSKTTARKEKIQITDTCVVVPHHVDSDPDSTFTLMQIRMRIRFQIFI